MDIDKLKDNVEEISDKVHQAWMKEKLSQGFHAPCDCPVDDGSDDSRTPGDKFTRRCGKCHSDLYPYSELPEHIKEYDRVTVKAVLSAIEQL